MKKEPKSCVNTLLDTNNIAVTTLVIHPINSHHYKLCNIKNSVNIYRAADLAVREMDGSSLRGKRIRVEHVRSRDFRGGRLVNSTQPGQKF